MLIALTIFVAGFLFAIRTSRTTFGNYDLGILNRSIWIFLALLFLILATFVVRSTFVLWLCSLCPSVAIFAVVAVLRTCRKRRFRSEFRGFLDRLILLMRTGASFRQALEQVQNESPTLLRSAMAEIIEKLQFSSNTKPIEGFAGEILTEFYEADRLSHRSLQRLVTFRHKLKVEDDFRRKSGQVVLQIRIQSFVMCGLYFALLAFVGWQFGFSNHLRVIILSFCMFLAGLLWIVFGHGRIKWKV